MKLINLVVFFLIFSLNNKIYCQINPPIPNPKKIIFTYKTVPNFYFRDKGVYADTILLKKEFPRIKYILKKSPIDTSSVVGFISKGEFNNDEIKNLKSLIFHCFTETKSTYKIKSKTLKYEGSLCKSEDCTNIFKNFFNDPDTNGTNFSPSTIYFNDEKKTIFQSNQFKNNDYNYKNNIITWSTKVENVGTYNYISNRDNYQYTNAVIFNPTLDKHINPQKLFSNCEYGVEQVLSIYTTTTLTSVTYE